MVKANVKFTVEEATKAQKRSRRHSSTLSLTLALDGGRWPKPRPGRFTSGKDQVPIA